MVEIACAVCGEPTLKKVYLVQQGRPLYCSRRCVGKAGGWWNKKEPVVLVCRWCEESFEVLPSEATIRKFCGRPCADAHRRTVKGSDHFNWKTGKVVLICETCDKPYEVFPYRADKSRFCCGSCRATWVQSNSPRTSSIEFIVADELDRRKLKYKHSSKLGKFVPDFVIDKTVLEVDGDYWHNLPGLPERDAIKNAYYEQRGFAVIRIWEHEVNAGDFSKLDILVG